MISWENYEEYMIMHADGELQPAEEQELMAFVGAHPELKSELAVYDLTRLPVDETLVYPDKDSLLRKEPTRLIAFPQWKRYAVAAGIAALLFISFYKYREANNSGSELVKTDRIKIIAPVPQNNTPTPLVEIPAQNNPTTPAPKEKIQVSGHQIQNVAVAHEIKVKHSRQYPNKAVNQDEDICVRILTSEQMQSAPVASMKLLPRDNKTEPVASLITIPTFEPKMNEEEPKRSFIDRLPIDESNKHQLKAIARLATGAAKAKRQLDEKQLTLRVEDNKLKISF